MRALIFSSILFSMFLISCGSSSSGSSSGRSMYQDPHSRAHSQMHNELYQEEIQKELNKQINNFIGRYEGTLPCTDCDAITIQIELFDNFTYEASIEQSDKPDMVDKSNGNFTLRANGIVELDKAIGGTSYFQKITEGLMVLDQNGKEIISGMNKAYVLKNTVKKKVAPFESDHPMAAFLKKKWDQGIEFYALGNEPSWSLDISKNDSLLFKTQNGTEHKFPFTKALPSIDPTIIDYRSASKKSEIVIQIVQKTCSDTMSEDKFSYQVSISIKTEGKKEFNSYVGCGNYVPNYKLNGSWTILEANGVKINQNDFPDKEPFLTLDLFKQNVSGYDGCNNFQGKVNYKTDQITFGPTAGTLMACPNMELSNKITGSLSGKSMMCKLANDLILYDGNEKIMVLNRKD